MYLCPFLLQLSFGCFSLWKNKSWPFIASHVNLIRTTSCNVMLLYLIIFLAYTCLQQNTCSTASSRLCSTSSCSRSRASMRSCSESDFLWAAKEKNSHVYAKNQQTKLKRLCNKRLLRVTFKQLSHLLFLPLVRLDADLELFNTSPHLLDLILCGVEARGDLSFF